MTKCLFKALKAVDLEKHVGLFRSLGYESAGALAHFHTEHFDKLKFTEQELLRLIALLDVLKESTRDGKICPHYFNNQQSNIKSAPIRASWCDETIPQRNSQSNLRKQPPPKRSTSMSIAPTKPPANDLLSQRSSTVLSRQHPITPTKTSNQRAVGPKSFLNRPAVQHVKVKSYNYGVPTTRRPRNTSHRTSFHHGSIFVSSPRHSHDLNSYGKPAEIYVYARKRPLLPAEMNFQDTITVPDNKRIIIAENKANLDCTPLLKKTEFQFDHVFGSDISNKEIFESTVLPLILPNHRHNLTYICFGQTGSGKSHTIFGGKNTDGLLVYCTKLLLQETLSGENNLVCSFYEIYNNQVYDLVNAGKRLFVREDGEHHVNVIGIRELILQSVDDLHCVIDDGLTRRHHGKSAFNSNSSRSHAVFQVVLKNNYDASESFRLIFIDLAGSERATDAQNNLRQTRREGAQINWSLLALKECIRSMDMTHSHAPFRQSKLTHILRDSLVGSKTRTCLMANVSPPDDCSQCSLNTLQYASRIRDISIRHRHRSVPVIPNDIPKNYFDEIIKESEKPQRNFKPATSSTPVHRLMPAVEQRNYSTINSDTRPVKPIDIDWQIADDDISINGDGGDDDFLKVLATSTRDFMINATNQTNNHRFSLKKTTEPDESPSSYFPPPQSDIKKSSSSENKRSFNGTRLIFDDGNERQWKAVPAPTTNRHSETSHSTRMIPVTSMHMSDENPYSSATATESLGTRITKAATNGSGQRHKTSSIIDSLNLHKQYDAGATTSDTEPMIYSDRQGTQRDETGFLNNREELLSIVSSRLTPTSKRSSSATTSKNLKSNSPRSIKPKYPLSSPGKTRPKTTRPIKSASSTTSLTNLNQDKRSSIDTKKTKLSSSIHLQKFDPNARRSLNRHHHHHHHHQRALPLRVHHSSDSEEPEKSRPNTHRRKTPSSRNTSYSTRSEACQTINDELIVKNEPKPITEDNGPSSLLTPTSSPAPKGTLVHASLVHVKPVYDRPLQQQISPLSSTNINNPWPVTTSYSSPSKDFGIRVSDQLNALRTLLENRLTEPDESKRQKRDNSVLQSSTGTFARQFLHSFRQSSYHSNLSDFHPDDDDDDDDNDREVERNFPSNHEHPNENIKPYKSDVISTSTTSSNQHGFRSIHHHYEPMIQPSLSSLSDELNQARVSSSITPTSSSTIGSNLAAKIDTQETRILSSQDDGHPSGVNGDYPTANTPKVHTRTDSDHTSQNPYTVTSSGGSSLNHSPTRSPFLLLPTFGTAASTNINEHDRDKDSPLLSSSSFDALLNSLKTMREKDLDFILRNGDEKLIPVAD